MATIERIPKPKSALVTAQQFMEGNWGPGKKELVRGEMIEVAPDNYHDAFVSANISHVLSLHGKETTLGYALCGDLGVRTETAPDTVRGADVAFYSRARLPYSRSAPGLPEVVPDLTVEVYSPSNRSSEILGKVREYLDAGVLMVWVVHPNRRTVAIYRPDDPIPAILAENDFVENLPELPGFRCPVAEFFD